MMVAFFLEQTKIGLVELGTCFPIGGLLGLGICECSNTGLDTDDCDCEGLNIDGGKSRKNKSPKSVSSMNDISP